MVPSSPRKPRHPGLVQVLVLVLVQILTLSLAGTPKKNMCHNTPIIAKNNNVYKRMMKKKKKTKFSC